MIGFLILALASTPADSSRAPIPADSVVTLPGVRVERERPLSEARRRQPTGFVAEIAARRPERALRSLPELLGETAGLHVEQYGGLGAFSTVSVRGAPPNQVAVLLDGVPLTSPARGTVSLGDLPATAVERIEVYRGAGPHGFAAWAPGGAINLVTAPADARGELRVARGSFDTWDGGGEWSGALGPIAALAHAGYQGSAGDFRFEDDNGTPFNAADDSLTERVNNRFDAVSLLAGLSTPRAARLRLSFRQEVFRKVQGVPGLGVAPARHPRLALLRASSRLDVTAAARRRWPALRLGGSLLHERSRFRDPQAELGLGTHETDDRLGARALEAGAEWPALPLGFTVEASGSLRADDARPSDAADGAPDPPASRRAARAAALGLTWEGVGDRVLLRAARRWDRIEDRLRWVGVGGIAQRLDVTRGLAAPQLGARVTLLDGLEARGNWSKGERAPDFLELFGNAGSVTGNPALRPERSESWDAGFAWTPRPRGALAAALTVAHFESRTSDLVLYVTTSPSSVKAQNVARALVRGEELELRVTGPLGLSASGAFTRQDAIDRGPLAFWNGKRLPQHPAGEAVARVGWSGFGLDAGVSLHHLGDNYLDRYNRRRVARRDLLGASLGWRALPAGPRVVVEARNLTDDRAADVGGFPLPGRSVFVSLETRLAAPVPPTPRDGDPR